jgi:hypothetical protein
MLLVNTKGNNNAMGNWRWNNKITTPHQRFLGSLGSHHAPLGRFLTCHFATHGKSNPSNVWSAIIPTDGWIRFRLKKVNFVPLDGWIQLWCYKAIWFFFNSKFHWKKQWIKMCHELIYYDDYYSNCCGKSCV